MVGVRPIAQSHHGTGGQGKIYTVKAILLEAQSSGRIFCQLRKMTKGVTSLCNTGSPIDSVKCIRIEIGLIQCSLRDAP